MLESKCMYKGVTTRNDCQNKGRKRRFERNEGMNDRKGEERGDVTWADNEIEGRVRK